MSLSQAKAVADLATGTVHALVEIAASPERVFRAIASRDYQRAYRMWGENGPPGQTLDEFAEGFADTASVVVTTRAPSRIEGAAGSQYAEVPATVEATTTAGRRQRFEGTYTLRRSMVDGASPSQRRWHVEKASIREVATG